MAAGLGVAVIPEAFAGRHGTVGVAISAQGARRTVGLTWRSDRDLPPPAVAFRDFVVALRAGGAAGSPDAPR